MRAGSFSFLFFLLHLKSMLVFILWESMKICRRSTCFSLLRGRTIVTDINMTSLRESMIYTR